MTTTSTTAARTYSGPFAGIVNAAARANGLDPWLVAGLLSHESGFRTDAVSATGDVGVAQINLRSHPSVAPAQAKDPAFAIPWAARYLAELKAHYGGSTVAALRAYNTGSGDPSPAGDKYAAAVMGERGSLLARLGAAARDLVAALAFPLGADPTIGQGPGGKFGVSTGTHADFGNWQSDNAVDLLVPSGTPVYAVTGGTIGTLLGPLSSSSPQLAGQRLYVNTPRDSFYYAHLSKIVVKPGDTVTAGQLLGYSGAANGVDHLHLAEQNGNPLQLVRQLQSGGVKPGAGAVDVGHDSTLSGLWKSIGGIAGRVGDAENAVTGAITGGAKDAAGGVAGALAGPFKEAVAPFVAIGTAADRFVKDPAYPFLWLGAMLLGIALVFVGVNRLLGRSTTQAFSGIGGASGGAGASALAAAEEAPLLVAAA